MVESLQTIQGWPSHYGLFKIGRVLTDYSKLAESLQTIQCWPCPHRPPPQPRDNIPHSLVLPKSYYVCQTLPRWWPNTPLGPIPYHSIHIHSIITIHGVYFTLFNKNPHSCISVNLNQVSIVQTYIVMIIISQILQVNKRFNRQCICKHNFILVDKNLHTHLSHNN